MPTELFELVAADNAAGLRWALRHERHDLEACDDRRRTLLAAAVELGRVACVAVLLEHGADVAVSIERGGATWTLLQAAAGNAAVAQLVRAPLGRARRARLSAAYDDALSVAAAAADFAVDLAWTVTSAAAAPPLAGDRYRLWSFGGAVRVDLSLLPAAGGGDGRHGRYSLVFRQRGGVVDMLRLDHDACTAVVLPLADHAADRAADPAAVQLVVSSAAAGLDSVSSGAWGLWAPLVERVSGAACRVCAVTGIALRACTVEGRAAPVAPVLLAGLLPPAAAPPHEACTQALHARVWLADAAEVSPPDGCDSGWLAALLPWSRDSLTPWPLALSAQVLPVLTLAAAEVPAIQSLVQLLTLLPLPRGFPVRFAVALAGDGDGGDGDGGDGDGGDGDDGGVGQTLTATFAHPRALGGEGGEALPADFFDVPVGYSRHASVAAATAAAADLTAAVAASLGAVASLPPPQPPPPGSWHCSVCTLINPPLRSAARGDPGLVCCAACDTPRAFSA